MIGLMILPEVPIRQWVVSFPYAHGGHLERQGLLVRDAENGYLGARAGRRGRPGASAGQLHCPYRIALGPHQGRKAFTLRTVAPDPWGEEPSARVARASGFSLHAGVLAEAGEREKLERLCRYIARPPVATQRLSLTAEGQVRYQLKTPDRDGTTHVLFEPMDFIAPLAALVPKPRVNLTCYHGVLLRASCPTPFGPAFGCSKSLPAILSPRIATSAKPITPARRGKRACAHQAGEPRSEAERRGPEKGAAKPKRTGVTAGQGRVSAGREYESTANLPLRTAGNRCQRGLVAGAPLPLRRFMQPSAAFGRNQG